MPVFIKPESGEYPLFQHDIKRRHPNVSFPKVMTEANIAVFGYREVHPTTKPVGDVIVEGTPVKEGDVWKQVWIARQYNADELNDIADRQREQALAAGIEYAFPGGIVDRVQVFDRDMIVLTNIRLVAVSQLGNSEFRQTFRSKNNNNYSLTAQEVIDMTDYVIQAVEQIYINSWAIKDNA